MGSGMDFPFSGLEVFNRVHSMRSWRNISKMRLEASMVALRAHGSIIDRVSLLLS